MVSFTLSIPDKLKKRLARHREVRWSSVVRSVLEQQLDELEEAERIAWKSKLTEKDVEELAASVDAGMVLKWRAVHAAGR